MLKHRIGPALVFVSSLLAIWPASAAPDNLLENIRNFSNQDRQINQQREAEFARDASQQAALLAKSRERLAQAQAEQTQLKADYEAQGNQLVELQVQLHQGSGDLGEVFGVAKQVAGELQPLLADSLTSAELSNRVDALAFAGDKRIPTLQDLETLWYQLQQEMLASGEIKKFNTRIIQSNGETLNTPVIRAGLFAAATTQGHFLNWDAKRQSLIELPTQPSRAARQALEDYARGESTEFLLDPGRGQLFELLARKPKLLDRIRQGAEVGYLILTLGGIGLLIALWQLTRMLITEAGVQRQLKHPSRPQDNNPLGRVMLAAASAHQSAQAELRVDEAILKELPKLEQGQSFLKLLAAVAPLLGLLGTVVGMITTFQSITLFGTSDPKLMAGGISQALITTVLGLVVAIPLLFSHNLLSTRTKRLAQRLQEKSLALLAAHPQEKPHVS